MKVYNVLIKDRHADPEIHNFRNKIVAVNFAREKAHEYCFYQEDYKEISYDPKKDNGWILLIEYSCESDYVRVSEAELQ